MRAYHTAANQLRTTKLLSIKTESPTVKSFSFHDKECAKARPGQFLMLWIPGIDEIPLSVLSTDSKGTVSVAVKNVGEATRELHRRKARDIVGVRGPFGNNFTTTRGKALMIGGGTGIAPLFFLTKKLVPETSRIEFVLGAKTKSELLFMDELKGMLRKKSMGLITSTEDGTCGITGLCTAPLEKILEKEAFDMIYACGPEPMLLKALEIGEKHGIKLEVSLERLMRCAIGLCGSCVIGKYQVCKDGPIFNSEQLNEVRSEFGFSKRGFDGRKIPLC